MYYYISKLSNIYSVVNESVAYLHLEVSLTDELEYAAKHQITFMW